MSERKNVAKYFSHDSNARNDTKVLALRMKYGLEGYAVYFMLLERLRETPDYWETTDYNSIGFDFRCSAGLVRSVVEEFGLFEIVGDRFHSSSFSRRMGLVDEKKEQVSSARKKAASARWRKARQASEESTENANAMQMHAKKMQNDAKQNKTKQNQTKTNQTEKSKRENHSQLASEIIDYLNAKAGSRYNANAKGAMRFICARVREGFTLSDFQAVVDRKVAQWSGDAKMCAYLRPSTLFGSKMAEYLAEPQAAGKPQTKAEAALAERAALIAELEESENGHESGEQNHRHAQMRLSGRSV